MSNKTQVYFNSNCALTCVLYVSACTEVIIRHVNKKKKITKEDIYETYNTAYIIEEL